MSLTINGSGGGIPAGIPRLEIGTLTIPKNTSVTSASPVEVEFDDIPVLFFISDRVEYQGYQMAGSGGYDRPWTLLTTSYADCYTLSTTSSYTRNIIYARRDGTKVQLYGYTSTTTDRVYTVVALTVHSESEL